MPIVTELEIVKTFKLEKYGHFGVQLSKQFMSWLHIGDINVIYDRFCHLQGLDFVNAVLDDLNIEVVLSDCDIKRIPKSGPFIAIANHPLGGIDGLIMLKILLTYHPYAKVMANYLLKKIQPVSDYICPVNPFETRKNIYSSSAGIRLALHHLENGLPLGIFPAGEVSARTNKFSGPVTDKPWDVSALKFMKKAKVPVVPIYFHARNSELFYWMADINSNLRTARLPAEFINAKNKKIVIRIGHPISIAEQTSVQNLQQYGDLLREKVFRLKNSFIKLRSNPLEQFLPKRKKLEILQYQSVSELQNHFVSLACTRALLFESGDYQVYFTDIKAYPAIRIELGRLREMTFRAVGEGSDKSLDLDKYDEYYHHLILWNHKEKEIVGAYRMALGADIYRQYALKGFYISELFHLSGSMHTILSQSIEMGRAFIVKPYQQRPMPLFILWRGIVKVTKLYPEYRYLIGAASISIHYCLYSRSLMVEYLKTNHLDKILAKDVIPKQRFTSILKMEEKELVAKRDLKSIEGLIEEIEPQGLKIPVLIKKYLLQNAQILGFNVDSAFNHAVDALMYIRIDDIDKDKFDNE